MRNIRNSGYSRISLRAFGQKMLDWARYPETCQSYNLKENFFGYRGVPTYRTQFLLEELSDKHGVFIMVVVQATYTFDVNGCDAFSKTEIANLPCPIVYRLHSLRLETSVWWNLSCTDDTAVLHASASAKYGGGYRREFGSTIYSGLVRWNRWWTRHRFGKRIRLWVVLE